MQQHYKSLIIKELFRLQEMDFKQIFTSTKALFLLPALILNLVGSPPLYAAVSNTEIQALEKNYQKITNKLYISLAKNLKQCRTRTLSLSNLNKQLQKLSAQNKNVIGVCLIQNNLPLIQKYIDSKETFPIFQFLLDNNNLDIANKLYKTAENESDLSLLSNISFIYARYYLKHKQWKKVLQYVNDTYDDLTIEDANFAYLFTGIALQKLKQHRPAIKIYSKIPKNSKYYPAARLNIATAYIRQDWWTDAHIEINAILNNKNLKTDSEMVNRLYLVLGYSLLRKEFYRNSREAFRNIEINSKYFNKALLGIVLTATNQEDYISALNAINILIKKKTFDLSVDESHLLLPYIYEKLNQNLTASASYSNAQSYYQDRIKKIKLIINKKQINIDVASMISNHNRLNIKNNIVDFSKHFPVSFLEDSSRLDEFSNYMFYVKDIKLKNKYQVLKDQHKRLLSKMINKIFNERLTYLNSYMNQSRFGLARLFDNSNTAQN